MKLRKSFYRALRNAAPYFTWRINKEGEIRGRRGKRLYCPITAVYYVRSGEFVDVDDVYNATEGLNMSLDMQWALTEGADEQMDNITRPALLRAVNLVD